MRIAAAVLAIAGVALVVAALATAGGGGEPASGGRVQEVDPADRAPRGLEVWVAQGCGSCHAFKPANATGVLAPNLTTSLDGRSEEYIRTSIVAPSAELAPNYGDMMPPGYAQRIAPADLDALVAFLAVGSGR